MLYDYIQNLPTKNVKRIYDILTKIFPDIERDFIRQLKINALASRICYSNEDVKTLIERDEKLNDTDKMIKFLKKLSSLGHTSVFSHNVLRYKIDSAFMRKDENYNRIMWTLEDISMIVPELFSFRYHSYDSDLTFPSVHALLCILQVLNPHGIKYWVNWEKTLGEKYDTQEYDVLRAEYETIHLNDSYEGYFFINFRVWLEILKKIGKEDRFWDMALEMKDSIDELKYIELPLPSDIARIYIFNAVLDKPRKGSVILEGVSRVLTHQLVRHVSFYYEQRSNRYTKPYGEDVDSEFVIPSSMFMYENHSNKREIDKLFREAYKFELETYNSLVNRYKVKKEDARYVLGNGMRTTIMFTFTEFGLENFFEQRADNPKAQWEIRLVATILKEFFGSS